MHHLTVRKMLRRIYKEAGISYREWVPHIRLAYLISTGAIDVAE